MDVLLNRAQDAPTLSFEDRHEATHRIGNSLAVIAAYVRLEATNARERADIFGATEVELLLGGIAARIDAVAELNRVLSEEATHGKIELGDHLRKLCAALKPFASFAGPVTLRCTPERGCTVPAKNVISIALIVSELVTNSIKYAHPSGVAGTIDVACFGDKEFIVVEVADDGVGFPEGFNAKTDGGLGMRLIRRLAAQLGASLVFDNELGLRVQFFVPHSENTEAR